MASPIQKQEAEHGSTASSSSCVPSVTKQTTSEDVEGSIDYKSHQISQAHQHYNGTGFLSCKTPLGKAPPVEIKLFVGRIPRTYDEEKVRPIFAEYGRVVDVVIIRDRDSGVHRGCAFVRMASISTADAAIIALNGVRVLDKALAALQVKYAAGEAERLGLPSDTVTASQHHAKLFVGSLPRWCVDSDVVQLFTQFGDVEEVYLMKDDHRGRTGCAFVKFSQKEAALHAIANLNGKYTVPGGTRAVEVRFADINRKTNNNNSNINQISNVLPKIGLRTDNWIEYFTDSGRPYYYHTPSNSTQWERPSEITQAFVANDHHIYGSSMDIQTQHSNITKTLSTNGLNNNTMHGPLGANIFVFHLPSSWKDSDLYRCFASFGRVLSARIAIDRETNRNKGFGFVSYADVASASNAVCNLNGLAVSGKRLKVQIKKGEESFAAPFQPTNQNDSNFLRAATTTVSSPDQDTTDNALLQQHTTTLKALQSLAAAAAYQQSTNLVTATACAAASQPTTSLLALRELVSNPEYSRLLAQHFALSSNNTAKNDKCIINTNVGIRKNIENHEGDSYTCKLNHTPVSMQGNLRSKTAHSLATGFIQ